MDNKSRGREAFERANTFNGAWQVWPSPDCIYLFTEAALSSLCGLGTEKGEFIAEVYIVFIKLIDQMSGKIPPIASMLLQLI